MTKSKIQNRKKRGIIIAPSILSADFGALGKDIKRAEAAGADWIHIDVMDGHFVPNITIGAPVVRSIRRYAKLTLDSHLMIENPQDYIEDFARAGSDIITIHAEAVPKLKAALKGIRSLGVKAGVSIKPGTAVSSIKNVLSLVDMVLVMSVEPGFAGQKFMNNAVPKIRAIRKIYGGHIQVDGGINADTAKKVKAAGADVLVAGSYIFGAKNIKKAIESLR